MASTPDSSAVVADGACRDPEQVNAVAVSYGFELLGGGDLGDARALAAAVLGAQIASLKSYQNVRAIYGAGIYGFREQGKLTGLSASFALNQAGLAALILGRLNTLELEPGFIATPGQAPAAYYGWGFLGVTKRAAATVVLLSRAIHRRLFWATPTYTRAVTEDGMRACHHLGFVRVPGGEPSLLWIAPSAFAPGASR
jgi:hypothetical protein